MQAYDSTMRALIEAGGGHVSGRYVTRPGVLVLATHEGLTDSARALFRSLGLDMRQSDALLLGEFGARLTYLSFPDKPYDAQAYHSKLIDELGHLSSYSLPLPAVMVAGCSLEAGQEFVAHHEAQIARLTSSATRAQDFPFFALQGNDAEQSLMRDYLESVLALPKPSVPSLAREASNMLAPSCKATAMAIGMNIKDWRKVLTGRQSKVGVEAEVMKLASRMQSLLSVEYPGIISPVKDEHA